MTSGATHDDLPSMVHNARHCSRPISWPPLPERLLSRASPSERMRLWRLVRSMPSSRAALDTFQSVWSSAWRMRSRSAESRVSCRPDGRGAGGMRISSGTASVSMRIARAQDRHALDGVAQLADVARPVVALEQRQHVLVDGLGAEVVAGAELAEEVGRQVADVLRPLAQRRHADRHHAEPVEQVLAELALGDALVEPAVGGRDDAHRHADRTARCRAAAPRRPAARAAAWPATPRAGRRPRRGRCCRRRPARTCRAASSRRR